MGEEAAVAKRTETQVSLAQTLLGLLKDSAWEHVATVSVPGREALLQSVDGLNLSAANQAFLGATFPDGIYAHQRAAIEHFVNGDDVCVTTGTASGKSLPFYVAAIELLSKNPRATVIAVYPLKALGWEQEQKWQAALEKAGLRATVGRIDGQVPTKQRPEVFRRNRVVIMTPDIIHAWLLGNLGQRAVPDFLSRLGLVVVDEVHAYSGVFGSNSAFLFRRLCHALGLLGSRPQFVCASATVAEPEQHLSELIGRAFQIVGSNTDSSPKHPLDILLVRPPGDADMLAGLSALLGEIAASRTARFIAFVDSRKQTEYIASIVGREQGLEGEDSEESVKFDHLERLNVLPYRAGYERQDREIIQERLTSGSLRGVVSTSALELGIDIPSLDLAVLVGVPRSSTSLVQRIGRIGRHVPGAVVVIGTDSVSDKAVFADPESILTRPQSRGTLYLENPRIQYIHALCLGRHGGEHDQLVTRSGRPDEGLSAGGVRWPEGFLELCESERIGQVASDLQSMKMESGDDPNHVFPLRDVESQFQVELRQGPDRKPLGSVSHSQLLREAYPGAVYYYTTRAFRVYKVLVPNKQVLVRPEKRYATQPQNLPTLIFPNLTAGNVFEARKYRKLFVAECSLQIRETVYGFKERRGPNEFECRYPPDPDETGVYFPLPSFSRNYFTTGVILSHPCFQAEGLTLDAYATLLFEYFKLTVPLESSDVGWAVDRYRAQDGVLDQGARFLGIFDQTYGSLRLSGRLLEDGMLQRVVTGAEAFARDEGMSDIGSSILVCAGEMSKAVAADPKPVVFSDSGARSLDSQERIILAGSKGWSLNHSNEEFEVNGVFFNPKTGALMYRGHLASATDRTVTNIVPVASIAEIPGVSETGTYDYETGEVK